jgi:hypothetical protein
VGKLLAEEAEITIHYGYDLSRIAFSKKILLKKSDSVGYSEIIPRLWASKKIDELSLIETGKKFHSQKILRKIDENKKTTLKLGRQFGIVTPNASLLVLTSLEQVIHLSLLFLVTRYQYIQHKIKPSKQTLPQLHDAYTKHKSKLRSDDETKKKAKLEKTFSWWNSRLSWWKGDHTQ